MVPRLGWAMVPRLGWAMDSKVFLREKKWPHNGPITFSPPRRDSRHHRLRLSRVGAATATPCNRIPRRRRGALTSKLWPRPRHQSWPGIRVPVRVGLRTPAAMPLTNDNPNTVPAALSQMEDGSIVFPLVRTLLELFGEEQISEIPLMEIYIRRCGISEGMGCHLIEENNFLSGAFTFVVSCPWIKKYTVLLSSILLRLSEIWSQSEWVANLLDLFQDAQFRTSVYNVVAFFENQLLQYVHSFWTDEVASNVSEKLGAKFII
ncbi:hypothetical protein OsI_36244 [Oryza sativa Indica Group]|uniref:Uncharacterized protein n=1 Tax=Oryza sativa subsp. indica TaxID=39946 RepID=A2ZEM8_ORYSI|nr:hypothetical protein OsI_36244 [Oryza sativa Indica Group]